MSEAAASRPPPPPLYSSVAGEAQLRRRYDETLAALPFPHEERWVVTSVGRAHVVVCGPPSAPPLLLWHGTACPAPYMLQAVQPLTGRYRVHCPDIPCQGGSRSEPAVLNPVSHDHGRWCAEVMEGLGLLPAGRERVAGREGAAAKAREGEEADGVAEVAGRAPRPPLHVGISLGAALLLDLGVVRPDALGGVVLMGPGCLHRGSGSDSMPLSLALGFALYRYLPCALTAYLALRPMCEEPWAHDDPTMANVLLSVRHCNYFPDAPHAFSDELLRPLASLPTLLVTSERDIFGPGEATAQRARAVWPGAEVLLLRGAKHVAGRRRMEDVNQRILDFFEGRGLGGAA